MKKRTFFSPKLIVFSKKKKGLHFNFISDFPNFSLKIRVFSKKKKKSLQSESFSEETSATDSKLCVLFLRGNASFASSNIHHCSHGFHSAHTKEALRGNVAASNFHTAIIVRKAVSTTTFACFRGAPDKVSRRTVWEPLLYAIKISNIHK